MCLDAGLPLADELGVPHGEPSQHDEAARGDQRLEEDQGAPRQQRELGVFLFLFHQLFPHYLGRISEGSLGGKISFYLEL